MTWTFIVGGIVTAIFVVLTPLFNYFWDSKSIRRFPNASTVSGITNLWFAYQAYKGRRYLSLKEKHAPPSRKMLPIIRVGPNHLSFLDAQAIKDIHGHGTVTDKGWHYDLLAAPHRHLADVVDKAEHKRKRKVLAAALAQSTVETRVGVIEDKMRIFISQMDSFCVTNVIEADPEGSTVDYRKWAILFTQEVIAAMGFSVDLGFLQAGDDWTTAERQDGTLYRARYRDSIEGGMFRDNIFVAFPDWYSSLVALTTTFLPKFQTYHQHAQDFSNICRHILNSRLKRSEAGEKLNDFCSALQFSRSGESNNYPFGELLAEAHVILNAGSDSTGIAMTNTIYSLIQNPRALLKLQKELDEVLDENDVVAPYHKIKNLKYLRAVLDESLRMNTPSEFSLPRKTPPGGATISGHWIAGNVGVSTPTHAIHMDPHIWGDPENFRPERWLGSEAKDIQPYFLVFTTGPRGCVGKNVTYLEQYVMLASFLHRYGFRLAEPGFVPTRFETVVTLVDRLPLQIWRRYT